MKKDLQHKSDKDTQIIQITHHNTILRKTEIQKNTLKAYSK